MLFASSETVNQNNRDAAVLLRILRLLAAPAHVQSKPVRTGPLPEAFGIKVHW